MNDKIITSISIKSDTYHKGRVYMAKNKYPSFSKLVETALQEKIKEDKIT